MMKFLPFHTRVLTNRIPGETTLIIALSGCKLHCRDCGIPERQRDLGLELTLPQLDSLITDYDKGVTCVCFMGEGDRKIEHMNSRAKRVKEKYGLKTALFTGRAIIPQSLDLSLFDYVKIGSYIKDRGPLVKPTTNQRLYQIIHKDKNTYSLEDITYKYWKKHENILSKN